MKKLFTLFICLLGFFLTFAQEPTTKEEEILLDEFFDENQMINDLIASMSSYQFLYVSMNYNSDTYFSGRDIGLQQYNVRPEISYGHSNGFFANLSGTYYSEFIPKWDLTTATIGYGKTFGKKKLFKYHTSYSRSFYSSNIDHLYSNTLNVGISVRNKKRSVGTQLTGSYIFGTDQSFQITSRSYASFTLLNEKKAKLILKPQLSIIGGMQTIELAQISSLNGELITDYILNDVVDLINTQVSVPLQFNTRSFDLELGYNINLPSAIGNESKLKTTTFFNFSIAYLIEL